MQSECWKKVLHQEIDGTQKTTDFHTEDGHATCRMYSEDEIVFCTAGVFLMQAV